MRFLLAILLLVSAEAADAAADATVRDGETLQVDGVTYKLAGIDAPEFDQICVNEYADSFACGVEARDQLAALIGKRAVTCQDLGPDKTSKKWRSGVCTAEGDGKSLNALMVSKGFALGLDGSEAVPSKGDQAEAMKNRDGLWKGCFVAPHDFRRWEETAVLLGASCRSDKDRELRAVLFPETPVAPPGCTIKAKFALRAHVTGNVGVYQLQGCRAYPTTTKPDRWFCTEDEAEAAGFRRAYNCRSAARSK